jgi:SMI1-KNR4 cell-wall
MTSPSAVVWRWTTEPLSERIIRNAERTLGVEFPADYRACVRENHGGAPESAEFSVDQRRVGRVGLLLSLDIREDENVVAATQALTADGRLPHGLIAIIDDGEGRFVCLDYRADPSKRSPTVAYVPLDSEVVTVAEGFTAFLGRLGTGLRAP